MSSACVTGAATSYSMGGASVDVTCARQMTWLLKDKRYISQRGPVPDNRLQPIRGRALKQTPGQTETPLIDKEVIV